MQSYAMKRSATRGALVNAAAWRALVHLAGAREICAPWSIDGEM